MATNSVVYASELLGKGQTAEYFGGFDKEWWLYQIRNRRVYVQYMSSSYTITSAAQLPTMFIATQPNISVTLPNARDPTIGVGWNCYIKNNTTGLINVTSASLLDGKASPYVLKPKNSILAVSGGANGWHFLDTTARYVHP